MKRLHWTQTPKGKSLLAQLKASRIGISEFRQTANKLPDPIPISGPTLAEAMKRIEDEISESQHTLKHLQMLLQKYY